MPGNVLVYNPGTPDTVQELLDIRDKKTRPWYTRFGALIGLDILALGWVQRLSLLRNTGKVEYNLQKLIIE